MKDIHWSTAMRSFLILAAILAGAATAMAQNVNTTGVPVTASGIQGTTPQTAENANAPAIVNTTGNSVSVTGMEVTTTKKAGTAGVTTYTTEGPRGTTKIDVYEGSGGTKVDSSFHRRR
jgi:hypothetical protein